MYKRKYTGKGIGVAVLDTGIFPHIDFGRRHSVILQKENQVPMMITDMEPMSAAFWAETARHPRADIRGLLPDVALLRLKCWIVSGMAAVKMYFRLFSGLKILEKFIISAL